MKSTTGLLRPSLYVLQSPNLIHMNLDDINSVAPIHTNNSIRTNLFPNVNFVNRATYKLGLGWQ